MGTETYREEALLSSVVEDQWSYTDSESWRDTRVDNYSTDNGQYRTNIHS